MVNKMDNLVENILKNQLVSATEIFEERMSAIVEKKLYEAKRSAAAELDEVTGGQDPKVLRAKGYRRASEVLGLSPYDMAREKKKKRAEAAKKKREEQPKAEPEAPKVEPEAPKTAAEPKKAKKVGVIQRNVNTLMGREPDYDPKAPENKSKGGRAGRVARGIIGTAARLAGDFASGLEEESRPKRKIVLKKKKTDAVIRGIKKDKYKPEVKDLSVKD